MKKIILLMSLIVSSLFADITWSEYDDALEKAQKEKKPLMVMISRESCSVCKYMKNKVFTDKELSEYINEKFITVNVDVEQDFVPDGLTFIGTPTFYFLDHNEKKIDMINGGKNVKGFMDFIKKIKL